MSILPHSRKRIGDNLSLVDGDLICRANYRVYPPPSTSAHNFRKAPPNQQELSEPSSKTVHSA